MTPQAEKAVEELKKGEKKLAHTSKLMLIADSTGEDWEVVDEYERRDLADDSDDDQRIRQAEARVYQKHRRAQSQRKKNNPYFPEVFLSSAFVRSVQQPCGCPFS